MIAVDSKNNRLRITNWLCSCSDCLAGNFNKCLVQDKAVRYSSEIRESWVPNITTSAKPKETSTAGPSFKDQEDSSEDVWDFTKDKIENKPEEQPDLEQNLAHVVLIPSQAFPNTAHERLDFLIQQKRRTLSSYETNRILEFFEVRLINYH